jgi:predicted ATP-dependent endonuclease of OLD family
MKVKELYIKKYHQFEDFKLDLTYPEGHAKAGLPLDKVCFIGQSGTGKTSLLQLIKYFMNILKNGNELFGNQNIPFNDLADGFYIKPFVDSLDEPFLIVDNERICFANKDFLSELVFFSLGQESFAYSVEETNVMSILKEASDNIEDNRKWELFEDKMTKFFEKIASHNIFITFPDDNTQETFFYKFGIDASDEKVKLGTFQESWDIIKESIVIYREKEIQERLKISSILENPNLKSNEIFNETQKFQNWLHDNPNPVKELADNFLDKILNKFNLRIRSQLDFQKTEDISTIKIETLQGERVPNDFLSTGTRHIIESALPLFALKFENPLVLFDEPEKSLYPDIQADFIDFYTSFTKDGQFMFATHSPIIASSFEPWEIVELKFNPKTGKVVQELYYEGERHVDNYTINPQYLRWDDILQRVFDLDSEGNEKRVKALMKLATLESKLKKKNLSPEERENLWNEYLKLSKLTGWTTRITDEKN